MIKESKKHSSELPVYEVKELSMEEALLVLAAEREQGLPGVADQRPAVRRGVSASAVV